MPLTVSQLREEFLALPPDQQSEFIASVSEQERHVPLGMHPAWEEELHFRREELNAGRMETIPWEIVEKELDSLDDLP